MTALASLDPFEIVKAKILSSPMKVTAIANKSGVSRQTIENWLSGHTRKPQLSTIEMVLRILGYRIEVTRLQ